MVVEAVMKTMESITIPRPSTMAREILRLRYDIDNLSIYAKYNLEFSR